MSKKTLKIQLIVFFTLLLGLEVGARLIYFNLKSSQWFALQTLTQHVGQYLQGQATVVQGGVPHIPDAHLGYRGQPGTHPVHITFSRMGQIQHWHATETVEADGYRRTSALPHQGPALWIFGCSFTYGSYLNDEDTYPWQLQTQLPHLQVKNFGMGGYGQIQALRQFEDLLAQDTPAGVIVTYAHFHQERNIQSNARLFRLRHHAQPDQHHLPAGRIDTDGALEIIYRHPDDGLVDANPTEVTMAIFARMYNRAQQLGIPFWVAVYPDSHDAVVEHLDALGISLIHLRPHHLDSRYNLQPFDAHPNARANQLIAQELAQAVSKIL